MQLLLLMREARERGACRSGKRSVHASSSDKKKHHHRDGKKKKKHRCVIS